MQNIAFDKPACQNIRESLRKEWLETNGLGDYASSTIPCCNTRKYHGLLVANLKEPSGRHVLLSTIEESLTGGGKEFFISCRKHPGVYHPHGHEYMQEMHNALWPTFRYRIGNVTVVREIMMLHKRQTTLIRYHLEYDADSTLAVALSLVLKPLLAFRNFHALTHENVDLQVKTYPIRNGFMIQPYNALPALFMQASSDEAFYPAPDWCQRVQYLVEEERGFASEEDLFMPGVFEIPINDEPILIACSTEVQDTCLYTLWEEEAARRVAKAAAASAAAPGHSPILAHLAERATDFLITTPHGTSEILAGYHWFDAWGRDTCISLTGLTLHAGQVEEGIRQLIAIGGSAKNGLIPNCFAPDGVHHAYNSVDASLWYVWAMQQFDAAGVCPETIRTSCYPVLSAIVDAFLRGPMPTVYVDAQGLLHAGDTTTQLTWMDAMVNGQPVTPRHGCPVEINALWYNALAYVDELATRFGKQASHQELRERMRRAFHEHFWLEGRGYLADVWRDGYTDDSLRPNQLFAVALPYPVLDDAYHARVVEHVRASLLTPFGLRTLAPSDAQYCAVYYGRAAARDSAYHQGTAWPWLLGIYGDSLLRTSSNVELAVAELLGTITPLFVKHLARAGLGSISEVFDASPPYYPNGCIAQAWSVAESLRLLSTLRVAAPQAFATWEKAHFTGVPFGERALPT